MITQQPELPRALAELAEEEMPQTVTPGDLYKRAVYSHVQGAWRHAMPTPTKA